MSNSPADPLAELYARLVPALAGYDWFLFGARAAIHYGSARATVDVDLSLRLGEHPLDHLLEQLRSHGFVTRIEDWHALVERVRVLLLADASSGIEIDVVLTGPGLEEEFHARAGRGRFGETELPVIAPEDLLVCKLLAGRPQDLQDVEAVLAAQAGLDLDRVREVLAMLESALARSDLRASLERLLTKA